jgi:hypothetical protein
MHLASERMGNCLNRARGIGLVSGARAKFRLRAAWVANLTRRGLVPGLKHRSLLGTPAVQSNGRKRWRRFQKNCEREVCRKGSRKRNRGLCKVSNNNLLARERGFNAFLVEYSCRDYGAG